LTAAPTPSLTPSATPQLTASPTPRRTPTPTPRPSPRPTATPTPQPTRTPPPCTPGRPELTDPEHGSIIDDASPTLGWEYFDDCQPSGFRIEVWDADFVQVYSKVVGAAKRSWTVPDDLATCTPYFWQVTSTKPNGASAGVSEMFEFTVRGRICDF
jgi:hypothetical protein